MNQNQRRKELEIGIKMRSSLPARCGLLLFCMRERRTERKSWKKMA